MLNFQPWDELLQQYVDEQGLVNYQQMQKQSATKLTNWLEELSQVNPESLDIKEQLAFWLNLYNALVVEQILKSYPIKSILPNLFGVPNWLAFFKFFSRPVYKINQQPYSLNNIEHDTIRQKYNDPRIHFALVCAAIGCPLLRNQAYNSDRLETQLEEDAQRFINNPYKVFYDQQQQILYCSQIFKWYKKDFLKVSPSLKKYIQTYLSPPIAISEQTTVKYLNYDWHLNQRISS